MSGKWEVLTQAVASQRDSRLLAISTSERYHLSMLVYVSRSQRVMAKVGDENTLWVADDIVGFRLSRAPRTKHTTMEDG
jgi:hypothetical protein